MKKLSNFGRNGLFDSPFPAPLSDCHIELCGSRAVQIDGCRGVAFCSNEHIRISLGNRCLAVNGSELTIASMFGATVSIEGCITGIEFI